MIISDAEGDIEVNESGGKHSAVEGRYDLIPHEALHAMAKVLETGAKRYGEQNWRKLTVSDNINHAMRHLVLLNQGDTSEDHASHILCRAAFIVALSDGDK